MKVKESIFKAYDIRGLVGKEITGEVAHAVGRALADFLPEKSAVAVGYDMRPDSKEFAERLVEGLTKQGRDVIELGMITSDMLYFAVGKFGYAGGAMVTASHNPGKYNGIKLCREGAGSIGIESGLQDIKETILRDSFKESARQGGVEKRDIREDWVAHVLSFVDAKKLKDFNIAVDAGNGMAGTVVPILEKRIPLKATEMYFEPDGTFPNHPADPINPDNLKDLTEMVLNKGLDLGIAFDGDGDRAFLVDEKGDPVSGSTITAILADYFLRSNPGATILYNLTSSRTVKESIENAGGKAVRTKVGHSYIKAEMKKRSAVFAGEHSGHYYFRDNFGADSGLIAAIVVIAALSKTGMTLSELAGKYRKYFESGELNSEVEDKRGKIEEIAAKYTDGRQDRLDGLTVEYDSWWFNVRPSNTEPLLRLNVEADSKKLMEEKRDELLAIIRG